jgi:hypothetical protein
VLKNVREAYQPCTAIWILHLITHNFHYTPLLKSNPPLRQPSVDVVHYYLDSLSQNKLSYIKLASQRGNFMRSRQWHTGHILSREHSVVLRLLYTPLVPHEREPLGDFLPPLLIRTRFPFTFLSLFNSIYAQHHHHYQHQSPLRIL